MTTAELQALDQAHLLHPHAVVGHPQPPLVLVRGNGALVWDADGKEYIDGTGGLWLNTVGHGREELARAAADQIGKLEYYSSFGDLSNEPAIRLGERLAALAPEGLSTIHFTSGGSEGTETALKLARARAIPRWQANAHVRPDARRRIPRVVECVDEHVWHRSAEAGLRAGAAGLRAAQRPPGIQPRRRGCAGGGGGTAD
jgi:hypothetical protein